MKQTLILILLLFASNVFSHDTLDRRFYINGKIEMVFPLNLILPSSETIVNIENTNIITQTDSLGNFRLDNLKSGKYRIRIIGQGFEPKDTTIEINDNSIENLKLVFVSTCTVNGKVAEYEIKNGKQRLLILGGIVPIYYQGQENFEKKYNVKYFDFGCDVPAKECAVEYNKKIFEYLDRKYGKEWRREVRDDVEGL
jgi:hypothetical protein